MSSYLHIGILHIGMGWLLGSLLGAFFYGGLWWTITRGTALALSAALIVGSYLLRMLVTLAGFYIALSGGWSVLIATSIGFLAARIVVTRMTDIRRGKRLKPSQGGAS